CQLQLQLGKFFPDHNGLAGFTDEDNNAGVVELRNLAGINLSWTNYVWTFRGTAATAETSIDATSLSAQVPLGIEVDTVLADGGRSNFFGLGFNYDDGNWQVIGEVTRVEVDGK